MSETMVALIESLFLFECNYCDTLMILGAYPAEVVNGIPGFWGCQCETFYDHLLNVHGIPRKEFEYPQTEEQFKETGMILVETNCQEHFTFQRQLPDICRMEISFTTKGDEYEIDSLIESVAGIKHSNSGTCLRQDEYGYECRDIEFEGNPCEILSARERFNTFKKLILPTRNFCVVDSITDNEYMGD